MNISKSVGMVTAAIPIVGILIGGITFGINFKTDVQNIKTDVANQQDINADVEEWFASIPDEYDDSLLWLQADSLSERINDLDIPDIYDDSGLTTKVQALALDVASLQVEIDNIEIGDTSDLQTQVAELAGQLHAMASIDMT